MATNRSTASLRSVILILMFLVLGSHYLAGQDDATEDKAPEVLSILDFVDNSDEPDLAWLSAGMADMLITDLAPTGITLVDRDDIENAFAEQSLALMGLTEDDTLELGRMILADTMLVGSYLSDGAVVRIDARMVDVTTAAVLSTISVKGSRADIFGLEAQLAVEICRTLGFDPPPGLGEPGTASLPAAKAYYEGLALQTSGEVDAARKRFEESAALDPLFAKPRYSIEESWQLLNDFRSMRQQREVNTLWKKAEALKSRLAANPFVSDTDIIMATYTSGTPTVQTGTPPAEDPALGSCPSPAVCLWNLQITYWEIGNKSAEYFDDSLTEVATLREIVRLADQADATWPEDEWLPEILYWSVFAQRWLGEWEAVRSECERIFVEWPDFRMAWALEDMYEMSLEKLGG